MIVEERDYALHPGKTAEFVRLHGEMGMPIQVPILGHLIGHFTTETGDLNHVVHLWGYQSLADRDLRRAALAKAPGWSDYLAAVMPLLQSMSTRILVPTAFSPLK